MRLNSDRQDSVRQNYSLAEFLLCEALKLYFLVFFCPGYTNVNSACVWHVKSVLQLHIHYDLNVVIAYTVFLG